MIVSTCRTLSDYAAMFALAADDLEPGRRILDVASGGSTLVLEAREARVDVVSVDPLFARSPADVLSVLRDGLETSISTVQTRTEEYGFKPYGNVGAFSQHRRRSYRHFKRLFLASAAGTRPLPFVAAGLPQLPFADKSFDLVLVSHLLFAYGRALGTDFHSAALGELLRVGREVRIFPLSSAGIDDIGGDFDADEFIDGLRARRLFVHIEQVPYEMRHGANEMLTVRDQT